MLSDWSSAALQTSRKCGRYALKERSVLESVVQEETTGCGIASVANILGHSYPEMKAIANAMGIYASDKSLWSDTQYVRRMLLDRKSTRLNSSLVRISYAVFCLKKKK